MGEICTRMFPFFFLFVLARPVVPVVPIAIPGANARYGRSLEAARLPLDVTRASNDIRVLVWTPHGTKDDMIRLSLNADGDLPS